MSRKKPVIKFKDICKPDGFQEAIKATKRKIAAAFGVPPAPALPAPAGTGERPVFMVLMDHFKPPAIRIGCPHPMPIKVGQRLFLRTQAADLVLATITAIEPDDEPHRGQLATLDVHRSAQKTLQDLPSGTAVMALEEGEVPTITIKASLSMAYHVGAPLFVSTDSMRQEGAIVAITPAEGHQVIEIAISPDLSKKLGVFGGPVEVSMGSAFLPGSKEPEEVPF